MTRIKRQFVLLLLLCSYQQKLPAQNFNDTTDSLFKILKSAKMDTARVNILNQLTRNYIEQSNYQQARIYADSAYGIANGIQFKKGKATALRNIGIMLEAQGNYADAARYLMAALRIFREVGDKTGVASALGNLANVYADQGNYAEALTNQNASLKISREIGDKRGVAASLHEIALIYENQADYGKALEGFREALKIEQEISDRSGLASTLNGIGIIYDNQRNFQESLKNYQASLKIYQELGDKSGAANTLTNIGFVFFSQQNYSAALKTSGEALDLFRSIGEQSGVALSYNNMGNCHQQLGNYAVGLKNCQAALNIYQRIGDKSRIALAENNLGQVYQKQGNFSEALKHLFSSLTLYSELGDKGGKAEINLLIGEALSKQAVTEQPVSAREKFTASIKYLKTGLTIAEEIGARTTVRGAYERLAASYEGLKDYRKALDYGELYAGLKDSLMNNETTRKLEQQRTQFEVEKAVAEEKAAKEKLLAEQKLQSERKDQLMLIGFGVVALVFLFLVLLVRQRNQKRRSIEKATALHTMTELELQSLRAQLNPHFMFNSLNAIQDLILKEDNDRSHVYLSRFSKLLRMLLENANQPFVSVKEELDFLELYLSLENLRIPNLKFSIDKDPNINAEQRLMPNMILQPYIENAIWHGLSNKKGERNLHIRIHENGSATEFEIEDNGVGRKKAAELKQLYRRAHQSKGMELLSKRFELLSKEYGASIHTTVADLEDNGEPTGTVVKIGVPFSLSEQAQLLSYHTSHDN